MNTQERIKDIEGYLGAIESTVEPSAGLKVALEVVKMARFLLTERESLSSQVAALRMQIKKHCSDGNCNELGAPPCVHGEILKDTAQTAQAHDDKVAREAVSTYLKNYKLMQKGVIDFCEAFEKMKPTVVSWEALSDLPVRAKAEQAGGEGK